MKKGWFNKHNMDDGYVDLGGDPIKKFVIDLGRLYISKPDGIWKMTKHGVRKVRKMSQTMKQRLEEHTP